MKNDTKSKSAPLRTNPQLKRQARLALFVVTILLTATLSTVLSFTRASESASSPHAISVLAS